MSSEEKKTTPPTATKENAFGDAILTKVSVLNAELCANR
jgi:hypothetical protein